MDEFGAFFDGPRAQRAFTLRAVMAAPWSIDVRDEAPFAVVVMTAGSAWLTRSGEEPVSLAVGDVVLIRGPEHYRVADRPDAEPEVIVLADQRCVAISGESLSERMRLDGGSWGNSPTGETTMLVGAYHGDGELGRRLVDSLPPLAVLPAGSWASTVADLLTRELTGTTVGRDVMLDRLLDVLVVSAVRALFAQSDADAPVWSRTSDDLVAHALRLIHDEPATTWTVAELAHAVGLSRAAFARRFHQAVGEAPMSYVTGWRMALAADLLRQPGATVTSVATEIGYATPFAFSAAFKRHHGRSPRHYLTGAA